uniref:Uncharacterized protein n=1 Tax=Oryza barthii TaxID=65489 RepID=A0A0D3G909_9ORYZ
MALLHQELHEQEDPRKKETSESRATLRRHQEHPRESINSLRDQRAGRRRIDRKQEKRKGEESIGSGAASSRKNARTGVADAKKQRS